MEGKEIIIASDFNATVTQAKKIEGSSVRDPYRENLEYLISELDLLDMPLKNGKYMWNK